MQQANLLAWTVPKQSHGSEATADAAFDRVAKRDQVLARLQDLPWPPSSKRPRGRPTLQQSYIYAIQQAVLGSQWELLAHVESTKVPGWWRRGLPIYLSAAEIEKLDAEAIVMGEAETVPAARTGHGPPTAQQPQTGLGEGDPDPDIAGDDSGNEDIGSVHGDDGQASAAAPAPPEPARKPKTVVPDAAVRWFQHFADAASRKKGWNLAQSLRYLQGLCPSLFGSIDRNTPRRWAQRKFGVADTRGRPEKELPLAVEHEVAVHVLSLLKMGVPLTTSLAQTSVGDQRTKSLENSAF